MVLVSVDLEQLADAIARKHALRMMVMWNAAKALSIY
jgi:hypothetical protein